MTLRSRVVIVTVLAIACSATRAAAQWLDHPTAGIPRTADGKPNLKAPAPRTPDGKPDLSGLWMMSGLGYATNITDVEMLPWAQKVFKQRLDTFGHEDPAVSCLPEGPRTSLAGLDPIRIIQTPTMVVILYESGPARQIFTDGRSLPKDPTPTWMGYSIGRWEGETFVVETAGYNDRTWLDFRGHPHSEALRLTERFRRTDYGHMQLAMTFDDPKTYVKPWTVNVPMNFAPDTDLLENVCLENLKNLPSVGRPSDEPVMKVSRAVLARYAGTYVVDMLGPFVVSVDGDQLLIEIPGGGGKQAAIPRSDTLFMFPPIGGSIRFVSDESGNVTHFVMTIVEGDMKGTRK